MKNYLIPTVLAVVILLILGYFFLVVQPREVQRIENDWGDVKSQTNGLLEKGTWGTRVYIEFDDGSEIPLYFILNPTFSFNFYKSLGVYYSDKKVSKVHYILEGRAFGEASGFVDVKFDNFKVKVSTIYGNSILKTTEKPIELINYRLPVNTEWTKIKDFELTVSDLFGQYHTQQTYSGKEITVKFESVGSISYKPPNKAMYVNSTLPSPITLNFKVLAPGEVVVGFKVEVS